MKASRGRGTRGAATWTAVCGLAVTLSLAVAGPAALLPPEASADSSCSDAHFCTWYQAGYDGSKDSYTDTYAAFGWYGLNDNDRSTKNRFGARRVKFGEYDQGVIFVRDCVQAGGNNSNLHTSVTHANIGAQGTGNDC
jgi:hypothetical protein